MDNINIIERECKDAISAVHQSSDDYNKYIIHGEAVIAITRLLDCFDQNTAFERFRIREKLQNCVLKAYPFKHSIPSYDILCLCNIALLLGIKGSLPLILFFCNEILEVSNRQELLDDILKYKRATEKAINNTKITNAYSDEARNFIEGEMLLNRFLSSIRNVDNSIEIDAIEIKDTNIEVLLSSINTHEFGMCRQTKTLSSLKLIFQNVTEYSNNLIGRCMDEMNISILSNDNGIVCKLRSEYYGFNNLEIIIISKKLICCEFKKL